jgi:hypothetical protein
MCEARAFLFGIMMSHTAQRTVDAGGADIHESFPAGTVEVVIADRSIPRRPQKQQWCLLEHVRSAKPCDLESSVLAEIIAGHRLKISWG